MRVLIVGSSKLPIPAVKGGAVSNLIEQLIAQNEVHKEIELSCCSLYDAEAEEAAKKYTETNFIWAKPPKFVKFLDKIVYVILGKIFRFKRLLSLSFIFQVIWLSFFVSKTIKIGKYDKIIFENSIPLLFSLKLRGNRKRYQGKYYIHMHSVPRKYYGNARLVNECERLICISEYVANQIITDSRIKISRDKICIMYNCIDTNLFFNNNKVFSSEIRKKYNIKPDEKIVLFVGRLCKEKGIAELLQALSLVKEKNMVLLVAGSNFYKTGIVSSYEDYLSSLISDLECRVIFTGYIDYSEIPQYYDAADLVVLPSIWEEPAGMTIIEAMACHKPVITTKSGGIPEYADSKSCILLEKDDKLVESIAENIDALLLDSDYSEKISELAERKAKRFNSEFYYEQFLLILNFRK